MKPNLEEICRAVKKQMRNKKIIFGFTFDPSSLMFDVGINDWLDVIDAPDPLLVLKIFLFILDNN